jgi:hypothetical protein
MPASKETAMYDSLADVPRAPRLHLVDPSAPARSELDEAACRRLAVAVLARLAEDLDGPRRSLSAPIQSRARARGFFNPNNEGLGFWCAVLDLDPAALCAGLRRLAAQARRG